MPLYNFKNQFAQFVLDGSKPHTIRSRRKHPAVEGSTVYLYKGLRTRETTLLRTAVCLTTCSLVVHGSGITIYRGLVFDPKECIEQNHDKSHIVTGYYGTPVVGVQLSKDECSRLAWLDGFRTEHTSLHEPGDAFTLMRRFFGLQYGLPFCGDLICWNLDQPFYY